MDHNDEKITRKLINRIIRKDYLRLHGIIREVLGECSINVRSKGYSYILDAIHLIFALERTDLCLSRDIYPHIADKYGVTGISGIEHAIRNAIKAAYKTYVVHRPPGMELMSAFSEKPSNKEFLLNLMQEVDRRMAG